MERQYKIVNSKKVLLNDIEQTQYEKDFAYSELCDGDTLFGVAHRWGSHMVRVNNDRQDYLRWTNDLDTSKVKELHPMPKLPESLTIGQLDSIFFWDSVKAIDIKEAVTLAFEDINTNNDSEFLQLSEV